MNCNPYAIKWSVIEVNGSLTKKIKSQILKADLLASFYGSTILLHAANDSIAKEKAAVIITILSSNNRTGASYTITDKQFGLMNISYNGVARYNGFLKNFLIAKDGCRVACIPVTSHQIKNATKF